MCIYLNWGNIQKKCKSKSTLVFHRVLSQVTCATQTFLLFNIVIIRKWKWLREEKGVEIERSTNTPSVNKYCYLAQKKSIDFFSPSLVKTSFDRTLSDLSAYSDEDENLRTWRLDFWHLQKAFALMFTIWREMASCYSKLHTVPIIKPLWLHYVYQTVKKTLHLRI